MPPFQAHATRLLAAAIGLVQGLVLYWATGPHAPDDPRLEAAAMALLVFVLAWGQTVQLTWAGRDRLPPAAAAAVALPLALSALWVFWQAGTAGLPARGDGFRQGTFVPAAAIALYVALPYVQVLNEERRLRVPYEALHRHSWTNAFVIGQGALFAGLFWALIVLWAGLFRMLGVSAFTDLFFERPFPDLSLPAVYGLGVAIAREHDHVIDTLRQSVAAALRVLLPLLALIALLFLAALPVTGLAPLWATRRASPLLLTLLALGILFVNAADPDGSGEPPAARWLRRSTAATALALPAFAGLALLAVGLRIGQYGLMPERAYAAVLALVGGLYGLGYAAAALARRGGFLRLLRPVNVALSLVVAAVAVLLHTPLLDPLAQSARSQYARLASGTVAADAFDYGALRFELGREGEARLEALARLETHPERDRIRAEVEAVRRARSYYAWQAEREAARVLSALVVATPSGRVPDGLRRTLAGERWRLASCERDDGCLVFAVGLDDDTDDEYGILAPGPSRDIEVYDRDRNGTWRHVGVLRGPRGKRPDRDTVAARLRAGETAPTRPPYHDLRIGDAVFRFRAD